MDVNGGKGLWHVGSMPDQKGCASVKVKRAECDSIIRRCGESGIASVCKQSQRDCVLQPKVARNELPWVIVQHGINRNAVAAILFSFGGRVTLGTTVGVVIFFRRFPRVARSSQPW